MLLRRVRTGVAALLLVVGLLGMAEATDVQASMVDVVVAVEQEIWQRLSFRLVEGEQFSIVFRHSVEKTLVYEDFILDSVRGLVLVAVRYESFGAGLPYSDEQGEFSQTEQGFLLDGLEQVLGSFSVLTTPENEYQILHPGGTFSFQSLPAGASLHVKPTDWR